MWVRDFISPLIAQTPDLTGDGTQVPECLTQSLYIFMLNKIITAMKISWEIDISSKKTAGSCCFKLVLQAGGHN